MAFCSRRGWSWPCFGGRCWLASAKRGRGGRSRCRSRCSPSSCSICCTAWATHRRPRGTSGLWSATGTGRGWCPLWPAICTVVRSRTRAWWPGTGAVSRLLAAHASRRITVRVPRPQHLTLPVADFLQRWLQHVPGAPDAGRPGLWSLPSYPHGGACALSNPVGPAASARASAFGLADRLCPAWRRASRAMPHLRTDARVHGGHSTRRCSPRRVG